VVQLPETFVVQTEGIEILALLLQLDALHLQKVLKPIRLHGAVGILLVSELDGRLLRRSDLLKHLGYRLFFLSRRSFVEVDHFFELAGLVSDYRLFGEFLPRNEVAQEPFITVLVPKVINGLRFLGLVGKVQVQVLPLGFFLQVRIQAGAVHTHRARAYV